MAGVAGGYGLYTLRRLTEDRPTHQISTELDSTVRVILRRREKDGMAAHEVTYPGGGKKRNKDAGMD